MRPRTEHGAWLVGHLITYSMAITPVTTLISVQRFGVHIGKMA